MECDSRDSRSRRRIQMKVRPRPVSSSRAEDIVTAELKMRQRQPDRPVHAPHDSLLSWSSSFAKYDGLFNWGALLLVLSSLRVCLENLLRYGVRVSPATWLTLLLGEEQVRLDTAGLVARFPVLYLAGYSGVPILTTLALETLLSTHHLDWPSACILHAMNLMFTMILPVIAIHTLDCGILSSVVACMSYTLIVLKLVSYIQVNKWCRDKHRRSFLLNSQLSCSGDILWRSRMKTAMNITEAEKSEKSDTSDEEQSRYSTEDDLVKWPDNLSIRDITYFMVAPTLCYELNFPKTNRKRKLFLVRRVLEVILGTNLLLALTQQWIVPMVIHSLVPFHSMNWPLTLERLLKMSLPNHIIWLIFFYIYFHSFLNTVGEVTNFADRSFYLDWWNSTNLEQFWKNWNLPVHKWAIRHLYKPLLRNGASKLGAKAIVFLLSAILHEYLLSVPLKMFKPWAFLGMLGQIPLIYVSKVAEERLGPRAGNVVMWSSLVLGHPLAVMMYYHDYVIENYGPSLVSQFGDMRSAAL